MEVSPATSNIKRLAHSDAHRICTSQVILSLGGAVKELIENAVDAGANNIEVRFEEYGCDLIEVIDDGCGIKEMDFDSVALPHATSKLNTFDGMADLTSFGFRGEALSSLASVGNLEIVTRNENSPHGFHLRFDQAGTLLSSTACSRQIGTTVRVLRLFEPLVVRRKELLRNGKREFHKAHLVVVGYALIGGVRITCTSVLSGKKQVVLRASGGSVRDNVAGIWGPTQLKSLMELVQVEPSEEVREEFGVKRDTANPWSFGLEGYMSTSEQGQGRSTSDRQFVYINSRPCDYTRVCKVANEVFKLFNRPQYPVVILNIKVEAGGADVNLTPDKRTILVKNEKLLLATLKSSMLKTYTDSIRSTASLSSSSQATAARRLTASQTSNIASPVSSPGMSQSPLSQFICPTNTRFSAAPFEVPNSPSIGAVMKPVESGQCANESDRRLNDDGTDPSDTGPLQGITISDASGMVPKDGFNNNGAEFRDTTMVHDEFEFAKGAADLNLRFGNMPTKDLDNSCNPVNEGSPLEEKQNMAGLVPCEKILKRRNSTELDQQRSPRSKMSKLSDNRLAVRLSEKPEGGAECYVIQMPNEDVENRTKISLKTCQGKVLQRTCAQIPFNFQALRDSRNKVACTSSESSSRPFAYADEPCLPGSFFATITSSKNEIAERELDQLVSKDTFTKMDVIGQFNLGFIITRFGRELFIVDQHASDEKSTFEKLQREVIVKSQRLIQNKELELSSLQEHIVLDNLPMFSANGFEFAVDPEGEPGHRVKLSSVPIYGNWTFDKQDIEELISNLTNFPGVMYRPTKLRAIFASKACRSSVMIGTALNQSQMEKIVKNLAILKQPWNCPHGRPTMRHLFSTSFLDDQFDATVKDPIFPST